MGGDVYRSVRMGEEEVRSLLRAMDQRARETRAGGRPRRQHPRMEFRVCDVLVAIKQPGDESVSRYLVTTRNLSAGGMAFVHGGYLHPGTLCSVVLTDVAGERTALLGVVRSCHHVTKGLHEVGVEFSTSIDASRFVGGEARVTSDDAGLLEMELPELSGRVLVVSGRGTESRAVTARLAATGLEVESAEASALPDEGLGEGGPDVVVLDAPDEGGAGMALEAIRAGGCEGPIVWVAEAKRGQALPAHDEVACVVRAAPAGMLISCVASLLGEFGDAERSGAMESVLAGEKGLTESIRTFAVAARAAGEEISRALESGARDRVVELCETLRQGGMRNGFAAVSEGARRALAALREEGEGSEARVRARLSRVAAMCARIRDGGEGETDEGEAEASGRGTSEAA